MQRDLEIIFGTLVRDPVYTRTFKGVPVCHLNLSVGDSKNGPVKWVQAVVWGKDADGCAVYLKKGKEIFLRGLKRVRKIVTPEKEEKMIEEFVASQVGHIGLI